MLQSGMQPATQLYMLRQCLVTRVSQLAFNNLFILQTITQSVLEIIMFLLESDAPVNVKNNNGWSSLVEAISFGSREISKSIIRSFS